MWVKIRSGKLFEASLLSFAPCSSQLFPGTFLSSFPFPFHATLFFAPFHALLNFFIFQPFSKDMQEQDTASSRWWVDTFRNKILSVTSHIPVWILNNVLLAQIERILITTPWEVAIFTFSFVTTQTWCKFQLPFGILCLLGTFRLSGQWPFSKVTHSLKGKMQFLYFWCCE